MLAPYLTPTHPLDNLSSYGLELLTTLWLEDIVHTELQRDEVDSNLQWLFSSGLYDAITRGSVDLEAIA